MNPKIIIGLSGKAGSGKDTAAQILCEKHGFTRIAFADAVRDALYNLDPLVVLNNNGVVRLRQLVMHEGWDKAKQNREVRELLQRMGTEAGRDIHGSECWNRIAAHRAAMYERVVFTDVRFDNEARLVSELGGMIVNINRESAAAVSRHVSENGISENFVSLEVENDGTIEDLHTKIEDLLTMPLEVEVEVEVESVEPEQVAAADSH